MKKYSKLIITSILALTFTFTSATNVNAVVSNNVATTKVIQPRAVGDTIAATFPDANLATAVATVLARTYPGTDVNTVLTSQMVTGLTYLNASSKSVSDLSGVEVFTNLTSLNVDKNNISVIPDSISSLTKLTTFSGRLNNISVIPDSFTTLSNLTELNLHGNNISVIPDSIGGLRKLTKIALSSNKLTTLPASFGSLTNLLEVDFSYNQITEIPDCIFNLTKLKALDISVNKLTSVPDRIGELVNLDTLELQYNRIASIPDSVGNLTKLEVVFLSENQLTSLPTTISSWTKVYFFEVGDNLLPTNYVDLIKTFGWTEAPYKIPQRKLVVKNSVTPYEITDLTQINNIDLYSVVEMNTADVVFDLSINPLLSLKIDKYTDDTGTEVDLSTYIVNGIVQKNGPVYAQVRAEGTGLYPNNSDNALTANKLQFNFTRIEFDLSFDLNGVEATIIPVQKLVEDEVSKVVDNPISLTHDFNGWNTKADGTGIEWILGTNKMSNAAIKLYAQWTPKQFYVTYDLDGGSIATDNPFAYTYGIGIPQFSVPTKAGFTFGGWADIDDNNNIISNISNTQTGNFRLKAIWTDSNLIIEPGTKLPGNENKLPNTGIDMNVLGIVSLLLISSTCVYRVFKYNK